jgi:adenylosuccinate synthase
MIEPETLQLPLKVVAISGPVGAGKSTLARNLAQRYGMLHIRTQDLMRDAATERGDAIESTRRAMQNYGEHLDRETNGRWVADGLGKLLAADALPGDIVIVDSVRLVEQVARLREAFPSRVTHVYLHAPTPVLSERYALRSDSGLEELSNYAEVASDRTENSIADLEEDADVSIDTVLSTRDDVVTRVASALRLDSHRHDRLVDVYVGGQYGSEGKGNVAYHVAAEYDVLMRVGGPNAGHKVPTDPEPLTHRQLPSGTLANPQAKLVIGPGATIAVDVLLSEIADCGVEVERLSIDPQAMIIEDRDLESEKALVGDIGSTGRGGGAAAARRIMGRGSKQHGVRLARDVQELAPYVRQSSEVLEAAFRAGQLIMLEGTQGTHLSLFHGAYPYVTSRDTTVSGTLAEAGIPPARVRRVVMVMRAFPIRVGSPPEGTSGDIQTETTWERIAERAGLDAEQLKRIEIGSVTARERRVGEFDWVQLSRSTQLNGPTDIALTFVDYIDVENLNARRYDKLTEDTIDFIEEIERVSGARVSLISTGFDQRNLIDRRDW